MKKILFVVNSLEMGGEQKVTTMIADELRKSYRVKIINFSGKQTPYFKTNTSIINFSQESRINFVLRKGLTRLIGGLCKKKVSPFFLNRKHLKELESYVEAERPETLILVSELPYYVLPLKKKFPQLKVIVWLHTSFESCYSRIFRYSQSLFIESLRNADKVFVLTSEDVESAKTYGLDVICINNPVTINSHGDFSNLSMKSIAFAGRYQLKQKGMDYLVQIAKVLPKEWVIQIAGTGNAIEVKKFKTMISKAEVADKIILLGALKAEEMCRLYQDSSIFIFTSRWEGFGLVLTEAMSFGLPIVAFACSGPAEVLEGGKDGILIKQGDVEEFAKQLNHLIESKKLRKEYSERSLERVKDFQMKSIIKQWKEII